MNNQTTVNIIAHDGITSLYTGVGQIALDTISVLCNQNILPFKYNVNAITGKYTSQCLGFNTSIRDINNKLLNNKGGRVYECLNGSVGDVSYGTPIHWKAASISAATILKNINKADDLTINLCLDTPFAQVAKFYSQYKKDNSIFVWIPHSTGKLHKTDSAVATSGSYLGVRLAWEQEAIDFSDSDDNAYVGYIGEFMKNHLINKYNVKPEKLLNFTNGLDLGNKKYTQSITQKKIQDILIKNKIPTDSPLIFSYGRLEPYKGFDSFIKIGGFLAKSGYKTLLLSQPYADDDPLIHDYQKMIKKYNPSGIFYHKNFKFDLPHIIMQWKKTKALILPSKVEPFGLIPEEARMYQNRAMRVIVSDVDGLSEQIDHGNDGFLVNFSDTKKAADQILQILNLSDKEIIKISKNGTQKVLSKYNLARNLLRSITEIYKLWKK